MTRTLLRGGYVHTPADPHATALCVEDGQIVWTGDDDASAHFVDGADRIIELEGRLVTPAFVDAHVHLAETGMLAHTVDLTGAHSLTEALDRIAAHGRSSSMPVLLGFGWDESLWPERRPFTREELDRAVGDKVAFLTRVDVHSAVVSSAFLEAVPELTEVEGYDVNGLVCRAANVAAREALFRLVPDSARADAIGRALDAAARAGIGMVHEMGAPGDSPATDFDHIRALTGRRTGERPATPEAVCYWGALDIQDAHRFGCAGAAGDLCVDGAIGSRTAALHAPYSDAPGTSGHLYVTADQVADHVVGCTEQGLQAGFHVIGDRAVSEVVDGLRKAAHRVGVPQIVRGRHRLEHLEMVDPEQMLLLGRFGVTASMQPLFDGFWGGPGGMYAERLGQDRARPMNAFASLNKAGVALAFGSDSPVTPFDPWGSVRAAAWHHTEQERITVRAAFNAHTRGGWRAARMDEGGVIALGAPASIAVWDVPGDLLVQTPDARVAAWSTDPRAGVPHLPNLHPDLELPRCVLTLVRGEVAFDEAGVLR